MISSNPVAFHTPELIRFHIDWHRAITCQLITLDIVSKSIQKHVVVHSNEAPFFYRRSLSVTQQICKRKLLLEKFSATGKIRHFVNLFPETFWLNVVSMQERLDKDQNKAEELFKWSCYDSLTCLLEKTSCFFSSLNAFSDSTTRLLNLDLTSFIRVGQARTEKVCSD